MLDNGDSGLNGDLNSAAQCEVGFSRSDNPLPAEAQPTVGSTREGADHGGEL